jgi:hypothetical protein
MYIDRDKLVDFVSNPTSKDWALVFFKKDFLEEKVMHRDNWERLAALSPSSSWE